MYNWNTDLSLLKKNPSTFTVWKLNQMINFGLHGERLDLKKVKKYWSKIETDTATRAFLKLLLWPKRS